MSSPTEVAAEDGPVLFDDDGLIGGRCASCDRNHFPRARCCPWCTAPEPASHRLGTDGVVWASTTVATAPPGYEGPVPFGFGVVELPADGLRVITRLELDAAGSGPAVGAAVRYAVADLGEDRRTWTFRGEGAPR